MTQLRDKQVLVLGLGETGLSLARWLDAQGARLRVADSRAEPSGIATLRSELPQAEVHCGAFDDSLLQGVDLVAISPGVPLADPFVQRAVARGIPVVGDIELFAQHLSTQSSALSPRVIAITGSNGKTTVTAMVEHMCRAAGKDVVAAGNISPAVLDAVLQRGARQPEVWVLELSSFQLETTFSLNADAAVVLNVSEDHLNRYAGMNDYAAAKARIFNGSGVQSRPGAAEPSGAGATASHLLPQTAGFASNVSEVQVLNRDDARSMGMALPGRNQVTFGLTATPILSMSGWKGVDSAGGIEGDFGIERHAGSIWLMQGGERLIKTSELQVTGLHNAANALAALALCRAIDLPMHKLIDALRKFKGLPHRVERVAEIGGVIYYDDSKGTNVGATIAALQGLGRAAVLIAGGEGKGQDFAPLKPVVARHARAVVLIGRDAPLIEAALGGCGVAVLRAKDMDAAVRQAAHLAQSGDAVLLSPACASFDMFRNYAHRAEVFVAAIRSLGGEGG